MKFVKIKCCENLAPLFSDKVAPSEAKQRFTANKTLVNFFN